MFRAGLKAGIIMGIVAIVVGVIPIPSMPRSSVPLMAGMLCLLLETLVLPFASGILAARFGAAAALTTGAAAGAGALAGAITEIFTRIVGVVMGLIIAPVIPRQVLTEMPGAVSRIFIFSGVIIAIAAGLGALGGIVGRAISARRGS